MINFTKPSITDLEEKCVLDSLKSQNISGDKKYTQLVNDWFNKNGINNFLLTTSGTSSLELAAILCNINAGDEVILPSFTFSSTANAFMLRGAKPIFVEIDKRTMNIDANLIEKLISKKTKAIIAVHYAGVSCDMDKINSIAKKYNLIVVEDAAQAVGSYYKGLKCGTLGDFGCYSFHETKNYCMGEGGGITIKNDSDFTMAEIIREKGTNRSQFIHGLVDKYSWYEIGSSFLPSDVLAALLYAQLQRFDEIMNKRLYIWNKYYKFFEKLEISNKVVRPYIPDYATHNAHIFYLIVKDLKTRDKLLSYLKSKDIIASFHYIPLHTSPLGLKCGYKKGDLPITESYSERLIRLPLFYDMTDDDINKVCLEVSNFYEIEK